MKKRIGIIDDDELLSEILSTILEDEGFSVKRIFDSLLIGVLEKENLDVLLLDVWFDTRSDGLRIARAIVHNKNLKGLPILIMSSDPNLKKYADKMGIKNYLKKPLDFDSMLGVVKKLSRAD